jgi:hypothetical protein
VSLEQKELDFAALMHMFFEGERIKAKREMILSSTKS